jgi:hypothetical protein
MVQDCALGAPAPRLVTSVVEQTVSEESALRGRVNV